MDNLDGTAQVPEVRILTQESEGFQTRTDVTGRRILQLLTHHPPAAKDKNSQQGTPVISEQKNEMCLGIVSALTVSICWARITVNLTFSMILKIIKAKRSLLILFCNNRNEKRAIYLCNELFSFSTVKFLLEV